MTPMFRPKILTLLSALHKLFPDTVANECYCEESLPNRYVKATLMLSRCLTEEEVRPFKLVLRTMSAKYLPGYRVIGIARGKDGMTYRMTFMRKDMIHESGFR